MTTYLVRGLDLDELAGLDTLLEGGTQDMLLDLLLLFGLDPLVDGRNG